VTYVTGKACRDITLLKTNPGTNLCRGSTNTGTLFRGQRICVLTPSNARYMIVNMTGEALKGHLDLLLLSVLSSGPAHGYAIIESLRARSGDVFDLPEGTVYPALHRLEDQGLLKSSWSEDTGRRKRVYQLTPKGQQALNTRQNEWLTFSKAVNATVGL